MTSNDQARLRAQLRNAERRLAEAERLQVNTVSAQYSAHAGSNQGGASSFRALNERIAEASDLDRLRAEVTRLRLRAKRTSDADERG